MPNVRLDHRRDGTPFVVVDFGRNRVDRSRRERHERNFRGLTDEQALEAGREWAEDLVAARAGGLPTTLEAQVERIVERHRAIGHSVNTVRKERMVARNYLGELAGLDVSEVTREDVDAQIGVLLDRGGRAGRPLSRTTVNAFRSHLHRWFNEMVDDPIVAVSSNPVSRAMRVKPEPPRGEPLDEGDVGRLLAWIGPQVTSDAADRPSAYRRNAAFGMYLALHTGMRVGEICALRRRDVRLLNNTVVVSATAIERRGGTMRREGTKGHRTRTIKIEPEVARGVRAHMAWQSAHVAGLGSDSPLLTVDGAYMRPRYLGDEFGRMRRECGIDARFKFHSLRHTHATWLLVQGVDLRTVSERLGHADPATTARVYAHAIAGSDERAAEVIGRTLSGFAATAGVSLGGWWAEGQSGTVAVSANGPQVAGSNEEGEPMRDAISTNYQGSRG